MRRALPKLSVGLRQALQSSRLAVPSWPQGGVLCALGGGADSAVMAAVVCARARRSGHGQAVHLVHVNHGLTGAAAALEDTSRAVAEQLGLPLVVLCVDVAARGQGLEAAARQARWEALRAHRDAVGAEVVSVGHTASDVAETFLQRVLEGAGRGQGVMPAKAGRVVRPLVTMTRARVRAVAEAQPLPFMDDPMNDDDAFLRVFLRHRVVPLLEQRQPAAGEALARAARLAAMDHAALEQWATATWQPGVGLSRAVLAALPDAVALRVLRQMVEGSHGQPVRTGFEACMAALAAARDPHGGVRHFKVGPVWLRLEALWVRATPLREEP